VNTLNKRRRAGAGSDSEDCLKMMQAKRALKDHQETARILEAENESLAGKVKELT